MKKKVLSFALIPLLALALSSCNNANIKTTSTKTEITTSKISVEERVHEVINGKERSIYFDGTMDEYLTYHPIKTSFEWNTNTLYILDSKGIYKYNDNYYSKPKSVIVPESIKKIPNYLFHAFTQIEEVTFHDSLESIGDYAFSKTSIKTINIPSSVKDTGYYSFSFCSNLSSLTLNEGLELINCYSFFNCALKNVSIPNTVKTIASDAFLGNQIEGELVIPSSVTSIEAAAFMFNDITSVKIGSGLNSLGLQVFLGSNSLVTIEIDSNNKKYYSLSNTLVEKEGDILVLSNKDSLIPDGIKEIGENAFISTEVKSITIPKSVTSIFKNAFFYCVSLEELRYDGTVEEFEKISLHQDWNKDLDISYVICSNGNFNIE